VTLFRILYFDFRFKAGKQPMKRSHPIFFGQCKSKSKMVMVPAKILARADKVIQ
jgi:hypothetical protein